MRFADRLSLSMNAVLAQRTRSVLTATGIAVGVAAVVLLTALGEGLHRFVLSEFTQFGTNIVAVTPGKTTTLGVSGALVNTVRPLSLDDAETLLRIPRVEAVVPVVMGNAEVELGRRSRRTNVYGVGAAMPRVWSFRAAMGRFLPDDPAASARALAVLGSHVRDELCGQQSPLGRIIRIGGDRYRVIGVMQPKGEFLGFDLDDSVYVPAARGLEIFDREGLMEIDLLVASNADADEVVRHIERTLIARHAGEDFTVTPQQQMLDVLGSVLSVLTFVVGGLGGISLLVGGVGILTIMTIALRERRSEIGLLRAIGATRGQVQLLFLGEAAALAAVGGLLGLVLGVGGVVVLGWLVPGLPAYVSPFHALIAEGVAVGVGLIAGVVPALRATRLDPVQALRAE